MIDKPKSDLAPMQANLDWFSHYLWNEPFPNDGRSTAKVNRAKRRIEVAAKRF